MEWIKSFFKEASVDSMIRLCCFLCVTNGIAICWMGSETHNDLATNTGLGMIGLGLTGKVVQKFTETKA